MKNFNSIEYAIAIVVGLGAAYWLIKALLPLIAVAFQVAETIKAPNVLVMG